MMRQFLIEMTMAVIVTLALGCWCASADTVTLKSDAYVKGPKVLLGDVAYIEGENAEALRAIEIGTAAVPGASRRIDTKLLLSRIEHAGFNHDSVSVSTNQRIVTATTMHINLTRELLADNLRDHIITSMPWDPEETLVDIVPPTGSAVIADGDVNIVWRTNPSYKFLGQGSFRGDISVDGRLTKTVYAKATIRTYAEILVATSGISRGELLTSRNVQMEKRDLSEVKTGVFFGTDEVAGTIAKSSIYAGQIVTPEKVMAPKIIKRNQVVRVQTRIGSLLVQSQAQALGDGAVGDVIRCRSLKSREEFTGVVGKNGVLMVY